MRKMTFNCLQAQCVSQLNFLQPRTLTDEVFENDGDGWGEFNTEKIGAPVECSGRQRTQRGSTQIHVFQLLATLQKAHTDI